MTSIGAAGRLLSKCSPFALGISEENTPPRRTLAIAEGNEPAIGETVDIEAACTR